MTRKQIKVTLKPGANAFVRGDESPPDMASVSAPSPEPTSIQQPASNLAAAQVSAPKPAEQSQVPDQTSAPTPAEQSQAPHQTLAPIPASEKLQGSESGDEVGVLVAARVPPDLHMKLKLSCTRKMIPMNQVLLNAIVMMLDNPLAPKVQAMISKGAGAAELGSLREKGRPTLIGVRVPHKLHIDFKVACAIKRLTMSQFLLGAIVHEVEQEVSFS